MKASASSGAAAAVSARDKREKYKADHGNKILPFEKDADGKLHFAKDGVLYGHVSDKWKDVKRWATDGVYEQFSQEKSLYSSIASDAKSMKNTSENLIRGKMHMFTMSDKTGTGFELKDAAGNLIKSSTGEAIKFGASASLEQVEKVVDALKATGKIEDAKIAAQLNGELQQRIKAVAKEFRDTATTKNYTAFNNSFMATSEMIEDKAMVELQDVASNFETLQEKYNANISLEGIKSFQTQKGTLDAKNVTDLADHLEVQMAQIDAKIRKEEAAGRGGKK